MDEKVFNEKVGEEYFEKMKNRIHSRGNGNLNSEEDSHFRGNEQTIIAVDPQYFRPTEVDLLIGDATKAREKLGWVPEYDLKELVADMMQSDIKLMKKDAYLKDGGYQTFNYFE